MTTLATRPLTGPTNGTDQYVEVADGADAFSRAVLDSVVNKHGETLSLTVNSEAEAIAISARLELLLITVGMGAGSASARIAPSFLEHTYPAMRALIEAMDRSGLSGLWTSAGGRCVRLANSWQMFISVDAPSAERIPGMPVRPDTLLEVVASDQVPTDWYRTRVAPRASARGLTTVFYSTAARKADGRESLFDRVRRSNLTREWRDGVRRHFDTADATEMAHAV